MNPFPRLSMLGLVLAVVPILALAQTPSPFEALAKEVRSNPDPDAYAKFEGKLVDCSHLGAEADKLAETPGSETGQWIYNAFYLWRLIPTSAGMCVYLSRPEKRGLSVADAMVILIAHEREFPIPETEEPDGELTHPSRDLPIGPYPEHFVYIPSWASERRSTEQDAVDCGESAGDDSAQSCHGEGPADHESNEDAKK